MGEATDFKFGRYIHRVHPNKRPSKINFEEKVAWAYPGTAQFFWIPPIIAGAGKATDLKFGLYIHMVHLNKISLIILKKRGRGRGRIQELPNFGGAPPIISGMGKATNFNFCTHIHRADRNKTPLQISGNNSRGHSQGLPKFFIAHRTVIFAIARLFC